jgi:hypothetical protein
MEFAGTALPFYLYIRLETFVIFIHSLHDLFFNIIFGSGMCTNFFQVFLWLRILRGVTVLVAALLFVII